MMIGLLLLMISTVSVAMDYPATSMPIGHHGDTIVNSHQKD